MRFYLHVQAPDGSTSPVERIELSRLPEVGTALRPPVSRHDCFVTRAVPASIEATGDVRIAGTIYADLMRSSDA
jgi:hypothetical protein